MTAIAQTVLRILAIVGKELVEIVRVENGFEIYFEAPDPDIYNDDLAMATAAMNRSVESVISVDPVQYQWSYKRFKRNESLPDPYSRQAKSQT